MKYKLSRMKEKSVFLFHKCPRRRHGKNQINIFRWNKQDNKHSRKGSNFVDIRFFFVWNMILKEMENWNWILLWICGDERILWYLWHYMILKISSHRSRIKLILELWNNKNESDFNIEKKGNTCCILLKKNHLLYV